MKRSTRTLPTAVAGLALLGAAAGGTLSGALGSTASAATIAPAGATTTHDVFQFPAHTVGSDVNMRLCPVDTNPHCAVVQTIGARGSTVSIACYDQGGFVGDDDDIWYKTSYNGRDGWVAGWWLDTGADPRPGIPFCQDTYL